MKERTKRRRRKDGLVPGQLTAMIQADEADALRQQIDNIGLASWDEYGILMMLLRKLQLFGKCMPKDLFHWWVANLPNSPVELMILRNVGTVGNPQYEILLIHRDDPEFPDCWHTPGSVILPGETVEQKLQALLKREVEGLQVSTPQFVTLFQHRAAGTSRSHEDCFLFTCLLRDKWTKKLENLTRGKFFPIGAPPANTLPTHKEYLEQLQEWLHTKYILENTDARPKLAPSQIMGLPRPW